MLKSLMNPKFRKERKYQNRENRSVYSISYVCDTIGTIEYITPVWYRGAVV